MKATLRCRVCGKKYKVCNSVKPGVGIFNWREVACSPDCGAKYLAAIMESRGITPNAIAENETSVPEQTAAVGEGTDNAAPIDEETDAEG